MDFKQKLIEDLKGKKYPSISNNNFMLCWMFDSWSVFDNESMKDISSFPESEFDKAYDFLMSLED